MKRRYCSHCGTDITLRPSHHYLCYSCWRDATFDNDYSQSGSKSTSYNPTYEERYKGDSEYDMGPDWDYDEYPPENLF